MGRGVFGSHSGFVCQSEGTAFDWRKYKYIGYGMSGLIRLIGSFGYSDGLSGIFAQEIHFWRDVGYPDMQVVHPVGNIFDNHPDTSDLAFYIKENRFGIFTPDGKFGFSQQVISGFLPEGGVLL